MDRNDVPQQDRPREELTWEMVDVLEEVLDHWEVTHSPLDESGLQKYMLARPELSAHRAARARGMSEPGREPWQRMLRDVHQLKKSRGREIVDSLLPQIKAKREAIPKRHPNGWLPVPELEIELPPQHAWVYAECFPYQNVRLLP